MAAEHGESVQPLAFGEWLRKAHQLSLDICPNCESPVGAAMCRMTYSTWHCWGCGAHLDSRVVSPRTVYRCENEWPDYVRGLGETIHPIACSCSGRGWYQHDEHPTLSKGYESAVSGGTEGCPMVAEHDEIGQVHVVFGWDDDYDGPWVSQADEGDAEDCTDRFEGDVPAALWDALDHHRREYDRLVNAAARAAGYDTEQARMVECCPEWQGDEFPGQTWWALTISPSESEDEWPRTEVTLRHHRSEADAYLELADLPEEFWLHAVHSLVLVRRDRFSVVEHGYGPSTSSCHRCGWAKGEHPALSGRCSPDGEGQ